MNCVYIFYCILLTTAHCALLPASEPNDEYTRTEVTHDIAEKGATKALTSYAHSNINACRINGPLATQLIIQANADINVLLTSEFIGQKDSILMKAFRTKSRVLSDSSDKLVKNQALSERFAITKMLIAAGANVHFTDKSPTKYDPTDHFAHHPKTILSLAAQEYATPEEIRFLLSRNPNPEPYEVAALKDITHKETVAAHRQWHTQTYRPAIQQQLLSYLPVFMKGTQAPLGGIIDEYLELSKDF